MRFTRLFTILTALILLMTTTLMLTTAEASNVGEILSIGIQSTKTPFIDPMNPKERDIESIYGIVYEGLIYIDDNYMPQPCLAESWDIAGKGATWTFHLRSGVVFSDGTPLTANDVVATINYLLNMANAENSNDKGYYCNLSYFVSSVSATNDSTVVIKLKSGRRYFGFLYELNFPIVKASQVGTASPDGTGPYIIAEYNPGSYMMLTINRNWWKTLPQVRDISVTIASTQTEVMENYQYARVDGVMTRSLSATQIRSGTSVVNITARTNQLETLLINNRELFINDPMVRKAIRAALDIDQLLASNYMGMASRTDTPMPQGTWMYNENLASYFRYNPDYARQLLEEAGWADVDDDGVLEKMKDDQSGYYRLRLRLYVYEEPDNNCRVETANQIAQMLGEVGFLVVVTTVTFSDMQKYLASGSYDLALAAYAMDVCPDPGFMLMKGNTGNYSRYTSNAMDDLCKKLRTCVEQTEFRQVLHDIQQRFAEDCPFICLYYRSAAVLTRKMYTTARDVRELEMLRGIETFPN